MHLTVAERSWFIVIALCLALATAGALADEPASSLSLESLLPADGATVDIMGFVPRFMELGKKLQEGVAKHPVWWLAQGALAKPGEPIAYDPRLGMTKEEYQEYLDFTKKMPLLKAKSVKVRVTREDEKVTLDIGEDAPGLKKVVLDLKEETLTTPFGVATEGDWGESPEDRRSPLLGSWTGVSWELKKDEKEPPSTSQVRFGIGKLKENGRGVLYYDVKHLSEKSRIRSFHVLQYDLQQGR